MILNHEVTRISFARNANSTFSATLRTFVTLNTRKTLMSASSAEALIPRSGYTSVSSPPDTLKEPLLEEKVSSSYAPSDNDGEQKKEVAETPDWWKG